MGQNVRRNAKKIALVYRGPQGAGKDEFTSFVPAGFFNILKSLLLAGYRPRLYNLSEIPGKFLKQSLAETGADAFLLSSFFGNHLEAARIAALLKKISPKAPVVLGGPFTTLGGEILRRWPQFDFVVHGEGEHTSVALLDALFDDGHVSGITGLCRRAGASIKSLPARLLEDIDRFFYLPSEVMPHCEGVTTDNLAILISSRGCPYRCAFCSSTALWKNRMRHHGVPLLIDYLKDLRQTTGAIYFSLRDENFLANKEQVRSFTDRLQKENLYYLFNAQGSASLVEEESAARLAAAGCDQLQMGIETISPRLQKLLGKQQSREKIRAGIAILRRHLIRPFGYFIYGMGEKAAEADENALFIRTSGILDAVASPLVHYPGTRLSQGVDPKLFFADREILFFDLTSRKRYGSLFRQAVISLAQQGAFREEEINNGQMQHLPARIARYYHLLAADRTGEAAKILLALATQEPDNPWAHGLLIDHYAAAGKHRKAAVHEKKLAALLGGKNGKVP